MPVPISSRALIREACVASGRSQASLGRELGLSRAAISARLDERHTIDTAFIARALDALGYTLVAVPHNTELPFGSRVLKES